MPLTPELQAKYAQYIHDPYVNHGAEIQRVIGDVSLDTYRGLDTAGKVWWLEQTVEQQDTAGYNALLSTIPQGDPKFLPTLMKFAVRMGDGEQFLYDIAMMQQHGIKITDDEILNLQRECMRNYTERMSRADADPTLHPLANPIAVSATLELHTEAYHRGISPRMLKLDQLAQAEADQRTRRADAEEAEVA